MDVIEDESGSKDDNIVHDIRPLKPKIYYEKGTIEKTDNSTEHNNVATEDDITTEQTDDDKPNKENTTEENINEQNTSIVAPSEGSDD